MKLFYSEGSVSLAIHIVLEESGLDFEKEESVIQSNRNPAIRFIRGVRVSEESLHCYAPSLRSHYGKLLTDVSDILQYITDLVPYEGLAAKNEIEHELLLNWLTFISEKMHKHLLPLMREEGEYEMIAAVDALRLSFDILSSQIKGNEYLIGERFTIADAYLFACLSLAQSLHVGLSKWKTLKNYIDFLSKRPAVKRALFREAYGDQLNKLFIPLEGVNFS